MHCLPIIDRDLRIAARRVSTYKHRLLAGGTASALVVLFAMFGPLLSSKTGIYLFHIASWCGFIVCTLEGLRETVDSIAQERREGTLGLLFLTDLRGQDVILGKLSAASIKSFSTLLAMLPAFALPIWMGGVTGGEFWRVGTSLVAVLIFTMTVGMFASAMSESSFGAIISSALLLGFGMLLPATSVWWNGPVPDWTAGPLCMFHYSADAEFRANPSMFWQALAYSILVACVLFMLSAKLVTRLGIGKSANAESWLAKLLKPTRGYTNTWAATSAVRTDPAVWLAEHTLPGRKVLWFLIAGAGAVSLIIGCSAGSNAVYILAGIQLFVAFLIKIWIAALAVQPMNLAKRSGAMELLLCTPLRPPQLVNAHLAVLRAYFLAPGIIASFGLMAIGIIGNNALTTGDHTFSVGLGCILSCLCFMSFLLDLNALAYVGLWHGLADAHVPQSVTKIVFRVLILPWICLLIPCVGFVGLFLVPWIWMSWAGTRLNQRFYDEASSQFASDEHGGWFKGKAARS
ncbi:MAG: hypothetical protein JWM68_4497 [Verrucomicrobiales bacterium]|nr:hypothetical protein [Verrucomicrobiales bacterium]